MDRRMVLVFLTFIFVAVGLLMSNQWLSRQIDELSYISERTETVFVPAKKADVTKVKALALQPTAVVEVDPKNDPLAPIVKAKSLEPAMKHEPDSTYIKYDEPPRENILPQ